MMHFAMNEAPIPYTRELFRLFRSQGVPTDGLFALGFEDAWMTYVKLPLHIQLKSIRRLVRRRSA